LEYHIRKIFTSIIFFFCIDPHSFWKHFSLGGIKRDGVAASKNWKTKSSLSTGVERVYTEKK
jgi:hypothetical protein